MESTVGECHSLFCCSSHRADLAGDCRINRDLQDPRPIIASLFGSSTTSSLPPHILSLYIHNGVKIYASWLSALSQDWDDSNLDQIRSISNALEGQLAECARSTDVELQERAAELHGLLEIVRRGLDAPRPVVERSQSGEGFEGQKKEEEEAENGFSSSTRAAPSSLTMLDSLFFLYELNPVNPKAQGMVTVPEGLDLDATVNPLWGMDKDGLDISDAEEVDDFGRPLRKVVREEEATTKKKKGKGSTKKGSSKRRGFEEDPEELERVSSLLPSLFSSWLTSDFFLLQQRLDRMERQREDPYYIGGSSTPSYQEEEEEDVDSIPIVKLDLNLPTRRKPTPPPREPTPPPMLVDVDGEMPTFVASSAPRIDPLEEKIEAVDPVVEDTPAIETKAEEGAVLKVVKKKKTKDGTTSKTKKKKSSTLTAH